MPTLEQGAAARVLLRLEEVPGPLDTACWIWPGARSRGGYGYVRVGGPRGGKVVTVHVLLYRVLTGRRPRRGQHVHHRCERQLCANPDHLAAVTKLQHARAHVRDVLSCGHAPDAVYGRRRMRVCRACRNEGRRAKYRERVG